MKVGIIGVGEMGENHVRVYHELGAEIVGIADLHDERVTKIANQYKTRAFTDYRELLSQGLDAVSITVPTSNHREVALAVIQHGANLLVEKPIADSIAHGKEIVIAAEKAGLKLMVGHIERFNPVVRKLKDIIEQGALGKVILLSARRVGPFGPRVSEVGIITDLATHDIDIARYIIAKEPVGVFSKLSGIRNKKGDSAVIILDFGDVTASIEVNWFTPHKVRTLVVTGTEGIAYVDYLEQTLEVHNAGWKMVPRFEKGEPLKLELEHFLECIEFDRQPLVNGYEGLKTLEIAVEAETKAHQAKPEDS